MKVSEKLFNKVLADIKRKKIFEKWDKVIVACSGGPDSLALLDIMARARPLFNLNITVGYFNHGLRPRESKREKEFVKRLSKIYGVRFISGTGDTKSFSRKNKVSIQESARHLRYDFFFKLGERLNIDKILLGHQREDSAETILLSFLKGAGLKGLSGIEPVRERDKFMIIRPLCDVSKGEIFSYLSERRLTPCIDSSNLKETYLRNRLRLKVMPFLRKNINPKVDEAVLRLGEIYSKENEYLDEVVSKDIRKVIREEGGKIYIDRKKFLKYHIAIERRFLREIFKRCGIIGEGSAFRQIEILRDFISGSHPWQKLNLARGLITRWRDGSISIERDGKPKDVRYLLRMRRVKLNIPGDTVIKELNIKLRAAFTKKIPSIGAIKKGFPHKVFFDAAKLTFPLYIRTKRPRDFFRPLGMKGTIKLKKYFINIKVPQGMRNSIPLVVSGGKIAWLVPYAISEDVKVCPLTEDILALSFQPAKIFFKGS